MSDETVREVEHAITHPDAWIEQMKRIGVYAAKAGLPAPDGYRRAAGHHGAAGYSTEYEVERYFRDAPDDRRRRRHEIQRNVIAGQLVARGGI